MEWKKKSKGSAHIYTCDELDHAIVDRRGYGIASAMGHQVSFMGKPFKDVDSAKSYAESILQRGHTSGAAQ